MNTEHTAISSPAEQMYIDTERQLALQLGWSSIVCAEEALLGRPPEGTRNCRGQALVPRWCRDWTFTGPLLTQYDIDVSHDGKDAISVHWEGAVQGQAHDVIEHPNKDAATRFAIVQAVIAKLEALAKPQLSSLGKNGPALE
jgi:hypothetical protein